MGKSNYMVRIFSDSSAPTNYDGPPLVLIFRGYLDEIREDVSVVRSFSRSFLSTTRSGPRSTMKGATDRGQVRDRCDF